MSSIPGTLPLVVAAILAAASAGADVREVGQLVLDGIPEIPQRIIERTNQYQNVRPATFADWAPDGGILMRTRFAETDQLHHVAQPGGARRQLTFFAEPVDGGSFGSSRDWLLFNRDLGGNEYAQIFRFDLRTGRETLLTDGRSQNGTPVWSNRRDRVAWRSTARNGADHDVWVMDPLRPEGKRMVLEVQGHWEPIDWSPDDRRLLIVNYTSSTESCLWVVEVESGAKTAFGNHDKIDGQPIYYEGAVFGASGDEVYFVSDERSEYRTLRSAKIGSTEQVSITHDIPWDVHSLVAARDRSRIAFTVNEGGQYAAYVMKTRTRDPEKLDLPMGIISRLSFHPDGHRVALSLESPLSPKDVYTVELRSGEVTRWTTAEVGGLDPSEFVPSELVHFPSFDTDASGDRRMIPAFVYKPRGDGPFPAVIRLHGGPESQAEAWFSYTSQYEVAELGCAVIYPNVRGSSGYGKSFLKLDDGFLREDSVKDVGALLDWIAEQPDLDDTRVGVTGGSYGGYMALAVLAHYGDRVRAGIDQVGISNFVTFLTNTAEYRRDLRRVEYGDERDPAMNDFLKRISPTNNVNRIRVPLFVVQGANDPRVPASEAEQIVAAVRANGEQVWYMLAKDEGHGFAKKSNADRMLWAQALFWETYLLGDGERAAQPDASSEPASSN